MTLRVEACRSCGAAAIWAMTTKGRMMLVDAEPSDEGNVLLVERPGQMPQAQVMTKRDQGSLLELEPLRMAHFATCPNADSWRRNRQEPPEP